jgi:hypothetical protein
MKCFVISPIGEEGSEVRQHADDVYEYIIEPAMKECGIEAIRSDHLDKPGLISEQMFRFIFEADLCIAVLTNHNPNVFYELAVAHSAQRPVIILIEKSQRLPFDVSGLRAIKYDLGIRSHKANTHINTIINHVKAFQAEGWKGIDLFSSYKPSADPDIKGLNFFEASGKFENERDWLKLLENTKDEFDIMGVALMGWRRTIDFEETVIRKAKAGCKIRMLLMHPENPMLPGMSIDMEVQKHNIIHNFAYFNSLAPESGNIEVRQILRGIPYFFLTRSDQYAVIIQYLSSQMWGSGPLWRCSREFEFYGVVKQEFRTLWELNSPLNEASKRSNP